jgi:hypothetical protein
VEQQDEVGVEDDARLCAFVGSQQIRVGEVQQLARQQPQPHTRHTHVALAQQPHHTGHVAAHLPAVVALLLDLHLHLGLAATTAKDLLQHGLLLC